jgi:hypothetical protein
MATSPFETGTLAFLQKADQFTQAGSTPLVKNALTPAAQALAATRPSSESVAALQLKAQGQYSNKQLVTPFKYEINVEGTWITVDALGKKLQVETDNQFKSIASLSAIKFDIKIIDQARLSGGQRAVKQAGSALQSGTATFNAASQIFNTGNSSIISNISNRFSEYSSLVFGKSDQVASNLASKATGALSNVLPSTQINQAIAKIPGIGIVTNSLGNLPGGSNLTSMLSNPLGSVQGMVGSSVSSITQQFGLPSLNMSGGSFDLGSLPGDFSQITGLATDIFHNGPPTSLQGIISLEKQIKGIICNFKLPIITLPSFDEIVNFKFPRPKDILKQIKKEFDDLVSNIINQFDIVKMLKELIPDPEEIYDAIITELTTCENNPNADKNSKAGQGEGSSESSKLAGVFNAAKPTAMDNVTVTAADRAAAAKAAPTSDPGFTGFAPGAKVTRVY